MFKSKWGSNSASTFRFKPIIIITSIKPEAIQMKQINKVKSIVLDSQTKTDSGSNDHQIYVNELIDHNPCSTEYNLSENDYKTLKLANALIISNLFEMVFIVFGCTIIYMTISYKWSSEFSVSLQLFILSDIIIVLEKAFFFYTLINKNQMLKICLCLNMSSMMLKLTASTVLSDLTSCLLLVTFILIFLSLPIYILNKVLTRRWKCIPEKVWKRQIIGARKQVLSVYH
ncbi:unnamed protein product (macronuclear) [Paramecium tetraurelia]|uniref:Uncharacterized protein n=1 Tax=Paramecium tetraurelia TaxID=5888 RepID=A0E9F4_PARTE|nr:uncharacterized protein GSPATT00024652001 [Paramecium tetraurelia]CAK91921.1 unnamed protein product [Paramecium tetraurelia]|eukprot:XP_001459318.1 hypothetical protein (macronuclear) [Paramecium tetraurelia strain d4-2]